VGDAEKSPEARKIVFRYRLSPEVRCEYMSSSVQGLTGYTPAEFFEDPNLPYALVHPDDLALLLALDLDCQRHGRVLRWVHRDGRVVWTEHYYTPICDDEGTPVAVEGVARDITAEMSARTPCPPVKRGKTSRANLSVVGEARSSGQGDRDDEADEDERPRSRAKAE
jgi:PAS domain S-box-containing protein